MKTTVTEIELRPYDDRSGYREKITAKWVRDDSGKDVAAHFELEQGEQRIVVGFRDWSELRTAIDAAIADTKWKESARDKS